MSTIFNWNIWRFVELVSMSVAVMALFAASATSGEDKDSMYIMITKNVVVGIYCHIQAKEFDENRRKGV